MTETADNTADRGGMSDDALAEVWHTPHFYIRQCNMAGVLT